MPGCAHDAAGDPRDGLAQIRDAFADGQANSVADDDRESDPVAERGGHVRALVNEVPLSIDTPVNHPVRPASGTNAELLSRQRLRCPWIRLATSSLAAGQAHVIR